MQLDRPLHPTERVLMGPGPSSVPQRVLQALAAPTLGHLDPEYLTIMDETRQMLRQVFQTNNEMTMAISGTGSARDGSGRLQPRGAWRRNDRVRQSAFSADA